MNGLFITGTDTDVGKTQIACAIARQLTQVGIQVAPRKPVESGCELINNRLIPADASVLKIAANYQGSLEQVCPFRFEPAISPQRAAELAQQELSSRQIANACQQDIKDNEFVLVEGAGGFYSPLCKDGLNADLAAALSLPVLLVAEDKLGCINHILLSLRAIDSLGLKTAAIILNQTQAIDNNLMDNFADLSSLTRLPLFQTHYQANTQNVLIDTELLQLLIKIDKESK